MAPVYSDHGYGGGTFVFGEGLDPVEETLKSIANRAEPTALLMEGPLCAIGKR